QARDEVAARKKEADARHVTQAKKSQLKQDKAVGITQDPDASDLDEHADTVFTAQSVLTKPAQRATSAARAVTKAITKPAQRALSVAQSVVSLTPTPVKRSSKVPPAPTQQAPARVPIQETDYHSEGEDMDDYDQPMYDDEDNYPKDEPEDDFNDNLNDNLNDELDGELDEDLNGELEYADEDDINTPEPEPIPEKHRIYSGSVSNAAFPCGHPVPQLRPLPGKPVPSRVVLDLRYPPQLSKQPRSDSLNNATAAPITTKATKITNNTGRPKALDYDDVSKEVILAAANVYRCLISTVNGFPDSRTEIDFVRQAWQRANKDAGIEPPIDMTPDIGKIIKQRRSQTCGKAKAKTASMVETLYGFSSGHGPKAVGANPRRAPET
ncbi:hypothetical protein DXG01_011598, partial [Tephrocybe rancida]